ncbi:hypothetical protein [Streptomyces alanosinicus]|uniref:Uncharacterized protein n=1 Tax=Streptomyces alanosinicus TaxID=68171 RepID=A0A918YR97_9ACTN|nr:hypothetical protein [Streptomyces alanosinicus]GHE13657.1 hypothetical protein GCM10010339_81360 [Streptomyces alanosinicus]
MPKDPAPSPDRTTHEDRKAEDEDPAPEPVVETVVETVVEDDLFGEITVRLDSREGEVTVEGESVPRVVLRRAAGTDVADHIPIGTRDGTLLILTVDGEEAVVTPARGRLTRRSYRVDVRHAGHARRLVPDSIPGSRLLRDGRHVGDFSSSGDGRVLVEWREDAGPNATDAALGYALAAAFGTGAQPMWMIAIEMIGDMIPG